MDESQVKRYNQLCARERELIYELKRIQERAIKESTPLALELQALRDHRDARHFTIDGITYAYTGPRPDYKLPEER